MSAAARRWRLLDTGARSAAENIALDQTMLELRAGGAIPNTLRLLKFSPEAALIGRHQSVDQELRTSFCRDAGIDINRRITGGGAVFFDSNQIGWELIAGRGDIDCGATMASLTGTVCEAAARGLRLLGIPAAYRPRNDIEVDGRKIAGTGGAWEGGAFLFQGTLLVDFDVETMLRALRVPVEKLTRHELESAAERVTCIADCLEAMPAEDEIKQALAAGLSEGLGIELEPGGLGAIEKELADSRRQYHESDDWIDDIAEDADGHRICHGIHRSGGGTVRASVSIDVERERVRSVLYSGDFFIAPGRAVYDLETRLRYTPFNAVEATIADFFRTESPNAIDLAADDFFAPVRLALDKLEFTGLGLSFAEVDAVNLTGAGETMSARAALGRTGAVLLPYCAKPPDCDYRFREGCEECGECSVGDAFAVARRCGITPVTIQSYEHLEQVFAECRAHGVYSYIGCCCRAFLVKRQEAFRQAGMAGVIIDIEDDTCYDLDLAEEAYAGRFEGATTLKVEIFAKLMEWVNGDQGTAAAGHGRCKDSEAARGDRS